MDTSKESVRTIVVGFDGSTGADRALRWGALEAVRTSATLHIVNVWSVPITAWSDAVSPAYLDPTDFEEGSRQLLERARSAVREIGAGHDLTVRTSTAEGGAAEGLMNAADGASLLVLGTRGHGGFASLVLGSVAATCAHHCPLPLTVVGGDAPDPGTGDIVVGLDDSAGGRAALRWAVAEAERAGVAVRAVNGWDLPLPMPADSASFGPLDRAPASRPRDFLEQIVADETVDATDRPPITVVTVALSAPEALISEAKSAAMLVVGSRGHGGFIGLLLGSVSQQCLHHSPCPVTIVPTAGQSADRR